MKMKTEWTDGFPTEPGIYRVNFSFKLVDNETNEVDEGYAERFFSVIDGRSGLFYIDNEKSLEIENQIGRKLFANNLLEVIDNESGSLQIDVHRHIAAEDYFNLETVAGTWEDAREVIPVCEDTETGQLIVESSIVRDESKKLFNALYIPLCQTWVAIDSELGVPVRVEPVEIFKEAFFE